jgi:uncharacterized SAM-binding protein YcdF (DUF218 family)
MAQGFFKKIMVAFFAGGLVILLLGAGILFWQKSYFDSFLRPQPLDSLPVQAVVVFAGGNDRLDKGVEEANRRGAANFIFTSGRQMEIRFEILEAGGLKNSRLWVNREVTYTDGDARYAAELLKKLKVQRALLVTSWYHLPRSAFLLRLYLAFSGIQIETVPSDAPPDDAGHQRIFQMEMVKFWGSLGRAALQAYREMSHSAPKTASAVNN